MGGGGYFGHVFVRLSVLRKTILNPEYDVFICDCVLVADCVSQF